MKMTQSSLSLHLEGSIDKYVPFILQMETRSDDEIRHSSTASDPLKSKLSKDKNGQKSA